MTKEQIKQAFIAEMRQVMRKYQMKTYIKKENVDEFGYVETTLMVDHEDPHNMFAFEMPNIDYDYDYEG